MSDLIGDYTCIHKWNDDLWLAEVIPVSKIIDKPDGEVYVELDDKPRPYRSILIETDHEWKVFVVG